MLCSQHTHTFIGHSCPAHAHAGIALVGNEDFALVDEAYPYISRRLLTDPSPRLREALRYMVYGRSGVFDAGGCPRCHLKLAPKLLTAPAPLHPFCIQTACFTPRHPLFLRLTPPCALTLLPPPLHPFSI